MCCSSPSPPDYGPMAASNEAAARYAKEAADNDLAFRKQQYSDARPMVNQYMNLATKVANQQLGASQAAESRASDQWNEFQQGRGVRDMARGEALTYGGTADQRRAAGLATADVNAYGANARAQSDRAMMAMGLNPSSGRAMAMRRQNSLMQGAMGAGAATSARSTARDKGIAMRQAFAGNPVGASISAQQSGLQGNFGTGAVGAMGAGANAWLPGAQYVSGGVGNAIGAAGLQIGANNALMGNMTSAYGTESANSGGLMGGLIGAGATLGSAYMKYGSDRRLKQDIVLVGKDERTGLNLYEFCYIDNPYTRFRGVMADEVELVDPKAVSEDLFGFKQVDYGRLGLRMEVLS